MYINYRSAWRSNDISEKMIQATWDDHIPGCWMEWKPANPLKTDAHTTLSQELCEVKARIFMESLSVQMDIKYIIYVHITYIYIYTIVIFLLLSLLLFFIFIIYVSKLPHTCNVYIIIYIYIVAAHQCTNPPGTRLDRSKRPKTNLSGQL